MTDVDISREVVERYASYQKDARYELEWGCSIRDETARMLLAMTDEIDRLTAELEKARQALEPFAEAYKSVQREGVTIRDVIGVSDLRTAARVHAELAEKEKE